MRRFVRLVTIAAVALMPAILVACEEEEETYAEQKEREAKQINAFLSDLNIEPISLSEFLKDTVTNNPETGPDFTKNEYVLFSDKGVYMQIVRRGEGRMMQSGERWDLNARYLELYVGTGDTMTMNRLETSADKMYVKRTGDTYTASFTSGVMANTYGNSVPNAWIMAFPYIKPGFLNGDASAKIRLIVPHNEGTQQAANSVYPTFYEITISTEKWQ